MDEPFTLAGELRAAAYLRIASLGKEHRHYMLQILEAFDWPMLARYLYGLPKATKQGGTRNCVGIEMC